jgi:hypothetical protein
MPAGALAGLVLSDNQILELEGRGLIRRTSGSRAASRSQSHR